MRRESLSISHGQVKIQLSVSFTLLGVGVKIMARVTMEKEGFA